MRIDFTNAVVEDDGYGVEVNGRSLEAIISTALGTRLGDKGGYSSGLPRFKANSCDVTVIITPHPTECTINTNSGVWHSVKEMEAEKGEQFQKENAEADPEE
jgi:hypothetical protein